MPTTRHPVDLPYPFQEWLALCDAAERGAVAQGRCSDRWGALQGSCRAC
jgi:hypothetical protein